MAKGAYIVNLSIDAFEKVDSYQQLLQYCKDNDELKYMLYQKIRENSMLAVKLLKDLTLSGEQPDLWWDTVKNVWWLCREKKDVKCLCNAQSYGLYLTKLLIAKGTPQQVNPNCISYSNSPVFTVTAHDRTITIALDLNTDAIVTVMAGTVDGTIIHNVTNRQRLQKGCCSFSYQAPQAGQYAIGVTVNGAVYKKTIVVK